MEMTLLSEIVHLLYILPKRKIIWLLELVPLTYKELIANCKAQEGASDSDVQDLFSYTLPSSRTGQCLNACVMENLGMMKDGKLSLEGSLKIAMLSGDATKVKNVEAIGKECQSIVGTDRCDSVLHILKCIEKIAAALEI